MALGFASAFAQLTPKTLTGIHLSPRVYRISYYILLSLLSSFLFQGCEKDDFQITKESLVNLDTSTRHMDSEVVRAHRRLNSEFYANMLEVQRLTEFYDSFYRTEGYFDWAYTVSLSHGESVMPTLLSVPIHHAERSETSGIMLYSSGSHDPKINYISRSQTQAGGAPLFKLTREAILAGQLILYNDFVRGYISRSALDSIYQSNPLPTNTDENLQKDNCSGGTYEYVCVYFFNKDYYNAARGLSRFLDIYPTYESIQGGFNFGGTFNGWSNTDLRAYLNNPSQTVNGRSYRTDFRRGSGYGQAFTDYLDARETFYNDYGIGEGPNGVLEGVRTATGAINRYVDCGEIFVPCWSDPVDYTQTLGNGGAGSGDGSDVSYLNPWQENYDELRFCEGYQDVFDTGPDNPELIHPNYDFCSDWMLYLETCILPDAAPFNNPANPTYPEIVMTWAEAYYRSPDVFTGVIDDPNDCVATEDILDYVPELTSADCTASLLQFENYLGTTLARADRIRITGSIPVGACGDQETFNRLALHEVTRRLTEGTLSTSLPNATRTKAQAILAFGGGSGEELPSLLDHPSIVNDLMSFIHAPEKNDKYIRQVVSNFLLLISSGYDVSSYDQTGYQRFVRENTHLFEESYQNDTGDFCCVNSDVGMNVRSVNIEGWHAERFREEVALLKKEYPYYSNPDNHTSLWLWAEYRILSGFVHTFLDIVGLFPGLGEGADALNAIFYLVEGDGLNASISAAAMFPIWGWTASGTRLIRGTIKVGSKSRKLSTEIINGKAYFTPPIKGNKSWKKFWDFSGDVHGHHIIPKAHAVDNQVLQKAAQADIAEVFHPHHIDNGFPLNVAIHRKGHSDYNRATLEELRRWFQNYSGANANQTAKCIKIWQELLRQQLSNPNLVDLSDIIIPRIPPPR